MDLWTFNWLFWIAGFFLAYELYAVITHGRTLSRQTWNWFSLGQRKRYWLVRRIVFVVFWLSLGIAHFLFQAPALWSVILPGIPFAAVIGLSSFVWKDATTSQGVEKEFAMPFKFSVPVVVAALLAGISAFGGAYELAGKDGLVTSGEWVSVAWVTISAIAGALYQQKREVWTDERRAVEAGK